MASAVALIAALLTFVLSITGNSKAAGVAGIVLGGAILASVTFFGGDAVGDSAFRRLPGPFAGLRYYVIPIVITAWFGALALTRSLEALKDPSVT